MAAGVLLNLDGTVEFYGTPEPPPVPEKVTNFQARAALRRARMFSLVDAAVKASGNDEALDAWEYANHVYRNGVLVQTMAAGLGLTPPQIDDLFRNADGIEA